jgi:hypothetical protein
MPPPSDLTPAEREDFTNVSETEVRTSQDIWLDISRNRCVTEPATRSSLTTDFEAQAASHDA